MAPSRVPIADITPHRRPPFNRLRLRETFKDMVEDEFWSLAEDVWPYTLLSETALYHYYQSLCHVIDNDIPGDVIECGVFFGGAVMFAAEVIRRREKDASRHIFALDTFTGFLDRTERDVDYDDNPVCGRNPNRWTFLDHATKNIRSIGFDPERLHIVPGDVAETIPKLAPRPISVLRLDTDTYETTKLELAHLYDRVSRGGVVIIDDYGFCKGCKEAVDEFIAGKRIFPMRIDIYNRSWVKLD